MKIMLVGGRGPGGIHSVTSPTPQETHSQKGIPRGKGYTLGQERGKILYEIPSWRRKRGKPGKKRKCKKGQTPDRGERPGSEEKNECQRKKKSRKERHQRQSNRAGSPENRHKVIGLDDGGRGEINTTPQVQKPRGHPKKRQRKIERRVDWTQQAKHHGNAHNGLCKKPIWTTDVGGEGFPGENR